MKRELPAGDGDPAVVIMRRLREGGYVSGQKLGAELGMSRAAVARWIQGLRTAGADIVASTRLGYHLRGPGPGRLQAPFVLPRLRTRTLGRRYLWLAACGSTNDVAMALARQGEPEGLVVVADRQTGGRGRLGRVWHSPAGVNLYVSVLLRPGGAPSELPPLTLLVGAAVADAVAELGLQPRLKWPNDVLLPAGGGWRKVAGVLTEMASDVLSVSHVVVGIGLNVNVRELPPELQDRATSLGAVLGRRVDRAALLRALLEALETAYERFRRDGAAPALDAWRRRAALGERCRVLQGRTEVCGVMLDVDDDGALRVRGDDGRIHRIVSGEVEASRRWV